MERRSPGRHGETSTRSGAGPGRDQSSRRQAGAHQREAGDLHQHRFRDALQTSGGCWALREATRKERTGEAGPGGGGRGREVALARRRAPGGACWWLGAPGTAEALEEAPPPFSPPRYWKDCVGETQKHTIIECGLGEGWTAGAAQRKTKSASILAAVTRGSSGRPLQPGRAPSLFTFQPPPPPISLGRSRARAAQGEASGKVSRFFSVPCPRPHPQFSGVLLPLLGQG